MSKYRFRFAPLVSLALLAACASAPPPAPAPPPTPPPPPVAPVASPVVTTTSLDAHNATPKLRLGHYSSADGMFGFVLDRTGAIPLARIDGKPAVLDLAVRRQGETAMMLLSANSDFVVSVSPYGALSMSSPDGRHDVALRRDADAEPLPVPPPPAVDLALLEALTKRMSTACGAPVKLGLARQPDEPAVRGAFHTLERATRAVERICRDQAGKDAVHKKLQGIRITDAPKEQFTFEHGTLQIEGDLKSESRGPFRGDIQSFLESKL